MNFSNSQIFEKLEFLKNMICDCTWSYRNQNCWVGRILLNLCNYSIGNSWLFSFPNCIQKCVSTSRTLSNHHKKSNLNFKSQIQKPLGWIITENKNFILNHKKLTKIWNFTSYFICIKQILSQKFPIPTTN